jgi:hypothetical protein
MSVDMVIEQRVGGQSARSIQTERGGLADCELVWHAEHWISMILFKVSFFRRFSAISRGFGVICRFDHIVRSKTRAPARARRYFGPFVPRYLGFISPLASPHSQYLLCSSDHIYLSHGYGAGSGKLLAEHVALDEVFSALTSDMITYICYGKDWKFLDHENFNCDIHQAGVDFANFFHINRFFPWIFMTLRALSPRMLAFLIPGRAATFKFQESLLKHAIELAENEKYNAPSKEIEKPRPNVISNLVNPSIPHMARNHRRLEDEVITILVAGTEAPVKVLSMAMYYLGSEPAIEEKLRAELKTVLPAPTSTATYAELEKLPYLVCSYFLCILTSPLP